MTYELAKQLKDAGFIPFNLNFPTTTKDIRVTKDGESVYFPTLSELIEACGDKFSYLVSKRDYWEACCSPYKNLEGATIAIKENSPKSTFGRGQTPEEAVAKLWLELNIS